MVKKYNRREKNDETFKALCSGALPQHYGADDNGTGIRGELYSNTPWE
jgi:hypothetical protein